jgi:hypothetical protein
LHAVAVRLRWPELCVCKAPGVTSAARMRAQLLVGGSAATVGDATALVLAVQAQGPRRFRLARR